MKTRKGKEGKEIKKKRSKYNGQKIVVNMIDINVTHSIMQQSKYANEKRDCQSRLGKSRKDPTVSCLQKPTLNIRTLID